jgi:hypothetical protein
MPTRLYAIHTFCLYLTRIISLDFITLLIFGEQYKLQSSLLCSFLQLPVTSKSRDSSVGIALGYRLDDRGSRVRLPAGAGNFSLHHRVQNGSGAHPAPWVPGALSLGVKRPGREADHSPPSSAKVKNTWSYTSTPQYVFMAWCLVKHRDNFTFNFVLVFPEVYVRSTIPEKNRNELSLTVDKIRAECVNGLNERKVKI